MALTAAEKQKRYRERIEKDPVKNTIQKNKDLERVKKNVKAKKIADMTEDEKLKIRKIWREKKKKQKQNRKQKRKQKSDSKKKNEGEKKSEKLTNKIAPEMSGAAKNAAIDDEDYVWAECRVCLRTSPQEESTDIFEPWPWVWSQSNLESGNTVAVALGKLANIDIVNIEGYPKYICSKCENWLQHALLLVKDVKKSDHTLKDRFRTDNKWPAPIQLEKNLNKEVLCTSMDTEVEVKQEVVSDDEFFESGTDEVNTQGGVEDMDIKIEPEEITAQSTFKLTVNGTISQDQLDRFSSMTNGCEVYEKEEHLESISVKEEPPSEDDVQSDIPLECMLCAKRLHTVSGLKAHVIAQHNYKSVKRKCGQDSPSPKKRNSQSERYVCDTCQRIFTTSTDLKVHEVCHDKFCCFACNAKFNSFSEVTAHRRRCKVKNTFVKPKTLTDILRERVEQKRSGGQTDEDHKKSLRVHCLRCKDSFKDIYEYKLHKLFHHGEKNFVESLNTRKIEIEIENIALDNAEQKRNDKEADLKEYNKIDYKKIETELESIFEIDIVKREVKITSFEENEKNDSIEMLDKKDNVQKRDQEQTIEEILSQETEPCNQIERQTSKTDQDKDENINDSHFFLELTGIDITATSECVTLKSKPKLDKQTNDSSELTEARQENDNAETDWSINHDEVNNAVQNTLKTNEIKTSELAKDSGKKEIELDVSESTSQAENNEGDVEIMQNTYRDTDKTSELKNDSDKNEIELDVSELTSQKKNNESDDQVSQDTYIETDKQSEQAKDSDKNEMELDVSELNSRKENKQVEVLNKIIEETSILTGTVNQNVLKFNVLKSNIEESDHNLNKNSEIGEFSKITEPINEIDEDISATNKLEENTVGNEKNRENET